MLFKKAPSRNANSHPFLIEFKYKFEFTKNFPTELEFFIFAFASSSSSSVFFIEFMLSSSSFCQVQGKFKTQSVFFSKLSLSSGSEIFAFLDQVR